MKKILLLTPFVASMLAVPLAVQAGAKITIDEDSSIDLGFRLQTLYINSEEDLDDDGKFENTDDFRVRRARLRLGADITRWISLFMQTEFREEPGQGSGGDVRLIDAFINLKPSPLANIIVGENMAPALRQNLTSSGGLMAIDRPGVIYKALTWGGRALSTFATRNFADTDSGLRGDVDVRDLGATLFGSTSLSDVGHVKYYLGTYDGVQNADDDNLRYTGRVQVNFFDPEPEYYNLSTYLGKKKTIGIGASFDLQPDVDRDAATGKKIDYTLYSVDAFAEYPLGPGSLTAEAAYINLDLDGAGTLMGTGRNARQAQGDGYYAQAGYFFNNWQPWVEYETWDSDGADGRGGYDAYRVGLSYFIKGHNANIKAGYEIFDADTQFTGTREDQIGSFVLGLYVTY